MGGVFNWTHVGSIRAGGLAGGSPGGGRRRGNRGASAAARFPAKCGAELGHGWSWELWWGLRKELKCFGGPESKRKGRFTAAVLMATAADSCALRRVQGRNKGVFIGHRRYEAVSPELRGLQEQWHGRGGGGRRAVAGGQWRKAARPPVSVGKPRGTDLYHLRASLALGVQW
jgi:hypothetical protein